MSEYTENEPKDLRQAPDNKAGMPFLIIFLAVAIVAVLSIFPWGNLTGNYLKDYSLLADLFPNSVKAVAEELIDPELKAALEEGDTEGADDIIIAPAQYSVNNDNVSSSQSKISESTAITVEMPTSDQMKPRQNGRHGDKVLIEDYTVGGIGLSHLRSALANSSSPARIAVIGDSYIEGDILTMDLRANLQNIYGGSGVGYVPLQSELTGFRVSVSEKCSGWTTHDIRKKANNAYKWLAGEYFVSENNASTKISGTSRLPHLSSWNSTKFLFISPKDAQITVSAAGNSKTFNISGSPDVQCISVPGNTSSASVSTSTPGVVALGMFLDGNSGVAVDCMSLRGNSGISHRKLSTTLATQMRKYIDYDLIIVEYGINALSSQQTNYSGYKKLMYNVIARLKACYPNADILIMGIGDRGQKVGTNIKSIPTAQNMVDTQRDLARETGVLFWDTREAMGGEDAIVDWRSRSLVNPDYIHLNAKGGKVLGAYLADAIRNALNR